MKDTATNQRLTALENLNILNTPRESQYDAITRLACHILDSPISIISFVTDHRQFFKSYEGLSINQAVVEHSFCAKAIKQPNSVFIIEDARKHPEFKNNSLVTDYPNIVFYAGIPIINAQGIPLGTLCVMDTKAKSISSTQIARLKDLAIQVMEHLKGRENKIKRVNPDSVRPTRGKGKRLDSFPIFSRLLKIETRLFDRCSNTNNIDQLVEQYLKDIEKLYPQLSLSFHPEKNSNSYKEDFTGRLKVVKKSDILNSQGLVLENFHKKLNSKIPENELSSKTLVNPIFDRKNNKIGHIKITGEISFALTQLIRERVNRFLTFVYEFYDTNKKLNQALEKLGYVNRTFSELIYEWNLETNEFEWGKNFTSIFGKQKNPDRLGMQIWKDRIHPNFSDKIIKKKLQAINQPGNNSWKQEYEIIKNDGKYGFVADNAIIIRNENGRAIRIVGSLKDISKEKTYEESLADVNKVLKERNIKLQNINEELEQFTHTASHDLQEPLRMIISFLTLLEKKYADTLDEKANNYIFYALDGAKRMRQLILGLLEISQIGQLDYEKEKINLNYLLTDVKKLLRRQIRENNAVILYDELPNIYFYYTPLLQVFQNLISNAIKYSQEGRNPEIKISCKKSKKKNSYKFTIEDNGKGIPDKHRDKVFIMFTRLENNKIPGSGMGLAIVKKIIDQYEGSIKLESKPGEGTKFTFTLPISEI